MKRKLVITKLNHQIVTSLLEEEEVVEIHCSEEAADEVRLGNIYVGKVKNIVANIGAAFIEVQKGVECYYALEQNRDPVFTQKIGKKPLCIGDELLVQVSKEAVKTKVPTVTGNISLAGKYAVLTVGNTRISMSGKLPKDARETFQEWMRPFQHQKYGWIVRTNARECTKEELLQEVQRLADEYEWIIKIAGTRTCFFCLKTGLVPYIADLRNIYQAGLSEVVVEDEALFKQMETFLREYQPEDLCKLRLYRDRMLPLHKVYGIERAVDEALKERVWMKSGAYLVIQPTEALTVIDVNTGKCISKKKNDETYYKINLEAAKEAAKQIRLRNLSGIILIDFINMDDKGHTEHLLATLRGYLQKDPIPAVLVDMTKLQLVEVTRKKVRKPLKESIQLWNM